MNTGSFQTCSFTDDAMWTAALQGMACDHYLEALCKLCLALTLLMGFARLLSSQDGGIHGRAMALPPEG